MERENGFRARWQAWRPTKTAYFWSCVACVVATIIVGFAWGGWVTGGTAHQMATNAAEEARTQLAAAVCVDRFMRGPDVQARLASLKKSDYWSRDDFLVKGGWVTLAGEKQPIDGAAELCADRLMSPKVKTKAS